jgi:L-fucose mutarotase/ribose pyranase (RbsD/FucU family)
MTKAYLLQVLIIDHDHLGADEIERVIEDANYPNDCIAPSVIKSQSVEVGDWDDDNPLNNSDTQAKEVDRLFSVYQPTATKVLTKEEYA